MNAVYALVIAACLAAVYTDVRARRIPNLLTGSLAAIVILIAFSHGPGPGLCAFAIYAAFFAVGLAAFAAQIFGGGDVKLAAAAAAAFGFPGCLCFLAYTLLCGGVLAFLYASARTMRRSLVLMGSERPSSPPLRVPILKQPGHPEVTLPYAVAIAGGSALFVLSKTVAPYLCLRMP